MTHSNIPDIRLYWFETVIDVWERWHGSGDKLEAAVRAAAGEH